MPAKPATAPRLLKDIMTRDPVCVTGDTSARELARILESNESSGCPVIDALEGEQRRAALHSTTGWASQPLAP